MEGQWRLLHVRRRVIGIKHIKRPTAQPVVRLDFKEVTLCCNHLHPKITRALQKPTPTSLNVRIRKTRRASATSLQNSRATIVVRESGIVPSLPAWVWVTEHQEEATGDVASSFMTIICDERTTSFNGWSFGGYPWPQIPFDY